MKAVGIILLMLLAFAGGWYGRGFQRSTEAQVGTAVAAMLQKQVDSLTSERDGLTKQASNDAQRAEMFSAEVDRLKALQAHQPRPAPAPPLPETDEETTAQLVKNGLSAGLQVQVIPTSLLAHQDARTTLSWAGQAARVPGLEARLDTTEQIVQSQTGQIGALKDESGHWQQAEKTCEQALAIEKKRGDVLQDLAMPPKWSAGIGASVDPRDGRKTLAVEISNQLTREVRLGSGYINRGYFVMASYSWGH